MKKFLLIAVFTITGLGVTQAQEFNFGVKGGVNLATITGDETDDVDGLTSFHAGILAEFLIAEKFAIQPEIVYSIQGATAEYSENFEGEVYTESITQKLNYVNVPLLFKYYLIDNLSIEAGPQIGYLISTKSEYEWDENGETGSETDDSLEDLNRIDFAISGGLSYKLDSGLFFNARYNAGSSNIYDFEESDDYSIKNSVFQLSVGFMF